MAFDPTQLEAAREGFDPARLEQLKRAKGQAPQAPQTAPPEPPAQSLYDESGRAVVRQTPQTGMPSAGDFDFGTSAKQVGRYVYDNFIQGQIIPIAASIAATRLPAVATGTAAKNVISPLVEGAYQGTAGYLADKANQTLDISPPGEDQAIAQGGLQGLAAMGQKAFRIMRPWQGRGGAVRANEIANVEAQKMVDTLRPPQSSSSLFTEASKDKASIPMTETRQFIRDAVRDMTRHDPTYNAENLPQKLRENYGAAGTHMYKLLMATNNNTPLPSDTWAWFHSQIGKEVKDMAKPGISSKGQGEASQMYEKMLNDIEKVEAGEKTKAAQAAALGLPKLTTGQGATKLLEALSTYRREQSVSRLEQHVKDAMDISRGQGADRQFNARTVIKALEKDRFFSKAFTPAERKDIQDTLTVLNKTPYLPPPSSGAMGTVHAVERGAGAIGGASVGGFWGAVAGFSMRDMLRMTENISFAMSTKTGRALVRELAQSKGGFTNKRNASVIASYVTAMKNQPMDEGGDGE